jgi:hypothetical protein
MPEVKLGDYKKTSTKINNEKEEEITITDEEVENTILDIKNILILHIYLKSLY